MNLLLLTEADREGDTFVVEGDRGRHLVEVLGVAPGRSVRVGMVDGPLGAGEVLGVDGHAVRLRVTWEPVVPERPAVDLLLAVPRPKVLKRLWAPLASLGVGAVFLTNAEKVERFYFDSHAVREEVYRPRLLEGLAQAKDTRVPRVEVHRSFRKLVEDRLAEPEWGAKVVADPRYEASLLDKAVVAKGRLLLAVGPEGGWNDFEIGRLEAKGFVGVGLGARVLRLDTAVTALLALAHEARRASRGGHRPRRSPSASAARVVDDSGDRHWRLIEDAFPCPEAMVHALAELPREELLAFAEHVFEAAHDVRSPWEGPQSEDHLDDLTAFVVSQGEAYWRSKVHADDPALDRAQALFTAVREPGHPRRWDTPDGTEHPFLAARSVFEARFDGTTFEAAFDAYVTRADERRRG